MADMLRKLLASIVRGGPGAGAELERGRHLLAAARAAQRAALATQGSEPLDAFRHYQDAAAALESAVRQSPAAAEALRMLAVVRLESGDVDGAAAALERATELPGQGPGALAELGVLCLQLGRIAQAAQLFERALAVDPQHPAAHAGLALALLGSGDFERGWPEYEWRLRTPFDNASRGTLPYPVCSKGGFSGKSVFVASEQGIGDEVMFASCIPDLSAVAASCVLECSRRLVPLFARSFPGVTVIPRDRSSWPVQAADCGTWAGSLPGHFRRSAASFPRCRYLAADAGTTAQWRSRLEGLGARTVVGIAWSGGLPETARAQRSIPLDALMPLFGVADVAFASLELLDRRAEAEAITKRGGAALHHWPGVAADPDQLAALISALDLVICVPGTAAHLSGALGRETWVLVAGAPTWRYGWDGENMHWYGSARVMRRGAGESLDGWVRALAGALSARMRA